MIPLQLFYIISHMNSHLLLCGLRERKCGLLILAQLQLIVTEFVLLESIFASKKTFISMRKEDKAKLDSLWDTENQDFMESPCSYGCSFQLLFFHYRINKKLIKISGILKSSEENESSGLFYSVFKKDGLNFKDI